MVVIAGYPRWLFVCWFYISHRVVAESVLYGRCVGYRYKFVRGGCYRWSKNLVRMGGLSVLHGGSQYTMVNLGPNGSGQTTKDGAEILVTPGMVEVKSPGKSAEGKGQMLYSVCDLRIPRRSTDN